MKKIFPYILLVSVFLLGGAGKAYFDNMYLNSFLKFGTPATTPATAEAGTSQIYYDATINGLRVNSNNSTATPQLMAGRNKIINGNFNVWQRGTALVGVSGSAGVAYLADRWALYNNTGIIINESQTTNISGVNGGYNAVLIQPNATTTIGGTQYLLYTQIIEGYNLIPLNNQVCTLSFWAKGTAATYGIALQGTSVSYVIDWVVPDTSWHQYVYTFTHSNSLGTWHYDNTSGMSLNFVLIAGSTLQQTAGTWQAASKYGSSAMTNTFYSSTSNSMIIAQVQLEAGPTATQFEQLDYQQELAKCQRYFWQINGQTRFTYGIATGTTGMEQTIKLPVPMRAIPVGSSPNVALWSITPAPQALTGVSVFSLGCDSNTGQCSSIDFNPSVAGGLTVGNGYLVYGNNNSSVLQFSADF